MSEKIKVKTEFNFGLFYGIVNEAQDLNGLADPYVQVKAIKPNGSHSKVLFKSTVIKNTLNPRWFEYGKIKVKDNVTDLFVELYDHDLVKDDLIGRQVISLAKARAEGFDETVFFENDSNSVKGNAVIKIQRHPFERK